jgi:hypothetical protein
VFKLCSQLRRFGDTVAIMTVLESPRNESFSTWVSLEPRNGVWSCSWYNARMHSFNASNDLLISAPSILRTEQATDGKANTSKQLREEGNNRSNYRVLRSLCVVSAPRSDPAKSMNDILPLSSKVFLSFRQIWSTAWEREESEFAPVEPVDLHQEIEENNTTESHKGGLTKQAETHRTELP